MTDPTDPPAVSLLLTTKLHRPQPLASLVPRPRLLEALTAGLDRRLTLVSAPAGYGKTTVVNQWLDSVDLPYAWLSLDEHDGDLATFLSSFLAAVRSVYPDAGRATGVLLKAPTLPAPGRLADSLLHDLIALPGELVLVLDDYHTLQTQDIHAVMARMVQHMPAHIHLVLTTRADPPLPLERLRGRQQLAEIRSADLSLTPQEAGQLLQQTLDEVATDEIVALLEESTEGWAVGLQLAALSLRGRSNPAESARKIAQSGPRLVMDYLVAEVLEGQPEALSMYLLQTSLLDRFCAPLCDAIQGETRQEQTGEDFLRAVRQSNLFLVPLDDEGMWFRYHHLFRYLLRSRTGRAGRRTANTRGLRTGADRPASEAASRRRGAGLHLISIPVTNTSVNPARSTDRRSSSAAGRWSSSGCSGWCRSWARCWRAWPTVSSKRSVPPAPDSLHWRTLDHIGRQPESS